MAECPLNNINFSGANLQGVWFQSSSLRGANFHDANLKNAHFDHSVADGANFTDAILTGANLTCASMENANFTRADLRGVVVDVKRSSTEGNRSGEDVFNMEGAPYLIGAIFCDTIMPDGSLRSSEI